MKDVLVSIVNHHHVTLLPGCIDSVLGSREVAAIPVVLDNHSPDGSAEMVRGEFPDVHLVALAENIGAAARNAGVEAAKGDIVFTLDNDVLFTTPDDVEHALYLLLQAAEHPRILKDPPAVARLLEFADYGMEIELRFWIGDPAEGVNNVRSDVNRRIWALFREHGITIPPAQREIRILEGNRSASTLAPRDSRPVTPSDDGQD